MTWRFPIKEHPQIIRGWNHSEVLVALVSYYVDAFLARFATTRRARASRSTR